MTDSLPQSRLFQMKSRRLRRRKQRPAESRLSAPRARKSSKKAVTDCRIPFPRAAPMLRIISSTPQRRNSTVLWIPWKNRSMRHVKNMPLSQSSGLKTRPRRKQSRRRNPKTMLSSSDTRGMPVTAAAIICRATSVSALPRSRRSRRMKGTKRMTGKNSSPR